MSINWVCTGKSVHGYQYTDAEGEIQNSEVLAIDFKAELDTESEAGSVNELFDTKPVLTEAGVEAFVGLQVYPQGFTVYIDERLTTSTADVIKIGTQASSTSMIINTIVGGSLVMVETGGGSEPPLG